MPDDLPLNRPLSQSPHLKSIDLPPYAEKVSQFATQLNQQGIKLAYHYHLMMLVETAEEIAAFFESTSEAVGLLLNTHHAYAACAGYGEILRRFGSKGGTHSPQRRATQGVGGRI